MALLGSVAPDVASAATAALRESADRPCSDSAATMVDGDAEAPFPAEAACPVDNGVSDFFSPPRVSMATVASL
jgi:hypothetical protein